MFPAPSSAGTPSKISFPLDTFADENTEVPRPGRKLQAETTPASPGESLGRVEFQASLSPLSPHPCFVRAVSHSS